MSEDLHDDESSVQVLRPAGEAPPPATTGARSVFDWRPGQARTPAPEQTQAAVSYPAKQRKATSRPGYNLQRALCKAMVAKGDGWTREDISAALPAFTPRQLNNIIFGAKDSSRIHKVGKLYHLTNKGLAYAAQAVSTPPATPPKPRASITPQRRAGEWPLIAEDKPARFAHFNDGGFLIEKNGLQISLSAEETRAMRTYQEQHL